jgi:hypothetical protein
MALISSIARGLSGLVRGIARSIRGARQRGEAETDAPRKRVYVWVTAHDEKVCQICMPLDGTEYEITSDYDPATVTLTQDANLYDLLMGAHPNCRCPQFSRVEYR